MKKTAFWCFLVSVVVLSLLPNDYLPPPAFNIWDKAQHAMAFAVLTVTGTGAYEARRLQIVVGLFLLGGLIELAQAATGWRYGEWFDLLADGIGIAGALGMMFIWSRLRAWRPIMSG